MSEVVYKLKHKPSGLYYQPVKGRWSEDKTNLSPRGKIYTTKLYPKMSSAQSVNVSKTQAKKITCTYRKSTYGSELIIDTLPQDWEVELFTLTPKL